MTITGVTVLVILRVFNDTLLNICAIGIPFYQMVLMDGE